MDPQPMSKVRDLSRLAGRVAARSTVRWSSLWKFLGICLLAAVVGGPAVSLPRAQGAAAVARMPRLAQGSALLPQRITFDPPQAVAVGQPVRLSASTDADANENLVVSFRSDTPDLCTVSDATVTPTAPGFCVITATQGGNEHYAAAPDVARAFLAHSGPEPQTITFDPPQAVAVGQPVRLSASTDADANENLVVSFRSDTPDLCTVSDATVTPTAPGFCVITATQGGNEHYAAARPARRSFEARTGARRQTIHFVPPKNTGLGQRVTLSASTDANENLVVSFRSESPTVCAVSRFTVTTVAAGTCDITAFQGGSATYAAAQASGSFRVIAPEVRSVQEILFDPVPGTTVGVPIVLTASSRTMGKDSPTGLAVSYTSQNRRVCTVSGATVVPRAGGRCMIIAAQDGNAQYLPAKPARQEFPVTRAAQTVTFTPPASATIGQSVTLTATASSWLPVIFASGSTDVCTVSGSTLTPAKAGTCTIVASQPGDDRYAAAGSERKSFPVGKIPQTISFSAPGSATVDRPVTLTAKASSGLPVIFASGSTDVCTVSGSTLTPAKAGTCTIVASQPGDDRYAAAGSERKSFPVGKIPQTISFSAPGSATVDRPVTLTAKASSGLPVIFASGSTDVCTVSGSTLTPAKAGTCTIVASQPGDDRYAAAGSERKSFPVGKIPQTISFSAPGSATVDRPVTLTAKASSGLPVIFASGSTDVCTVSGSTLTPAKAGTCTIVASQPGDDRYAAAGSERKSFPVGKIPQTISFSAPGSATVDRPVTLTAKASSGLPVIFASGSTDVCTVSGSTLTPAKAGTCTIVASQPGDDRYAAAGSERKSFPVGKIPQTISFSAPGSATVDRPVTLTAKASSGLPVIFASGSTDVCTVSGSTLTPAKAGTCTIVASQPGDDRYAAAGSERKSFPVARIPQTIDFRPPQDIAFGRPVTLTATASSGLPVSYRTSTPGVCTVRGRTVTTRAVGACAITAGQAGDDRYAPARDAARSFRVERAAQTITFTPPDGMTLGQPVTLSASATSGLDVSYRTDTPAACTVSGSTISPVTVGTCTITASQPGNDDYAPALGISRSFPVHPGFGHGIGKTPQAIAFAQPRAAVVGQPGTLAASATSGLAVSFRSDTPSVCTVSGDTVTAIAVGTCAVTASQAGDDHFAAARDLQRSFAVQGGQVNGNNRQTNDGQTKTSQAISFGQPQAAAVSQVVPLAASATSGLAVSFRSDTPAVCSVSGATLTAIAAGTCTITASQAGDNHYLAAPSMTESFQVKAGYQAQTISFPPPPQAKVGEAVSLSASATSGLMVAFRSDTPRTCKVSGATLTPVAAGTCTVTASQGGGGHYGAARDIAQSFDVASATSGFPGALTFLLGAVVFAAAGATSLVRRVRRRSHRPPEPQPTVRADPVPGPPTLVSVQNTGAGVTHTVRIESSHGATITRIKEGTS